MSSLDKAVVDHIGIAVKDLDEAISLWKDKIGLPYDGVEEVPGVKVAFFPLGESSIELVAATEPEGGVAKFVEKTGGGVHHICLKVPDIKAALAELKEKGARLIDEEPREGAHGKLVAFIHPKTTGGVLLELSQEQ